MLSKGNVVVVWSRVMQEWLQKIAPVQRIEQTDREVDEVDWVPKHKEHAANEEKEVTVAQLREDLVDFAKPWLLVRC